MFGLSQLLPSVGPLLPAHSPPEEPFDDVPDDEPELAFPESPEDDPEPELSS